jgi:PAS domain S-box-containing protein
MKSLLPSNEAERLAALRHYDVLDTPPEEAFDDLTLIAAHICQVPMAMVSLIDENRQWFKSKIGTQSTETPRDLAFCSHTILHADEVLEVRDASEDPRFAQHPLVTADPHIRFYAGAPLVTPDGHALGALCVIDRVPRRLTPAQLTALRALSRRVVDQLELRQHTRHLVRRAQKTRRHLIAAEDSRRALLSLLENQKQAEATLRESEERFRQITETIQEVFWMTDAEDGRVIYVSPSYEKIWGRTCASLYAAPLEWGASIYPEDRDRVLAAAAAKQVAGDYDETYRIVRPDGTLRWIRDKAFPVKVPDGPVRRIVGVAQDITEQKRLQEQFLRTQRLESIGMLAAGIAHDLNNVLAPISMASALLRNQVSEHGSLRLLATLEKCAERGGGLVRQILGFVHGIGGEPRLVQVKHLIRDIGGVITETFPKSIVLGEEIEGALWPIHANPTHIHQVLLNLCVNARDAMPHGGNLTLAARNCVLDAASAAAIDGAKPGAWIMIQVADTGTGIAPEVLPRIWDPFYSTKAADRGTGLGLSTVRGIVDSHGGFIALETTPGRGTTFRVYLPAIAGSAAEDSVSSSGCGISGRGELILVVDDEQAIRDLAETILEQNGYRVITAGDGVEAIARYAAQAADIALVLTDLDMPRLDGTALAAAIRRRDPAKKILAMSGHGSTSRLQDVWTKEFASGFLGKPFTAHELLDKVGPLLPRHAQEC